MSSGEPDIRPQVALSDATKTILSQLDAPVEIRFYVLLGPGGGPELLRSFAGRVDQLLAEYSQVAGGRIKVNRFDSEQYATASAALADGIAGFDLDNGSTCYLGIALVHKGRKESLSRLSPEWESALEPDLTRAIARLIDVKAPVSSPLATGQTDPATIEEVKRLIPNFASVSVEEGTRLLREAALKDFAAAAREMEAQLKQAQQHLAQAQSSGSADEQQAAMKEAQRIQTERAERLKQIAARSQAQIDVLQKLKEGAR